MAVYLEQRVLAVPAEAVAPPVKGEVVAIPIHRAGGQAGLVGTLPRPTLTGAGGQCPSAHTSLLEAPAARPHGWPGCASSRCWSRPPASPVPGVAAHVDGLAWLVAGLVVHTGAGRHGDAAAIAAGHQPVGTHTAGLALGAVLWEDRPRLMDDLGLQRGPRDSRGHLRSPCPGHGSSSDRRPRWPRAWRCGSRSRAWVGRRLGREGALREPAATQARCLAEELRAEIPPRPPTPSSPGSGVWPPMQVSVPWVQELPGEHGQRAPSLPHPARSAGAPTRWCPAHAATPRWGSWSPAGSRGSWRPAHTRRSRPGRCRRGRCSRPRGRS